jgi:hypothetical protein
MSSAFLMALSADDVNRYVALVWRLPTQMLLPCICWGAGLSCWRCYAHCMGHALAGLLLLLLLQHLVQHAQQLRL